MTPDEPTRSADGAGKPARKARKPAGKAPSKGAAKSRKSGTGPRKAASKTSKRGSESKPGARAAEPQSAAVDQATSDAHRRLTDLVAERSIIICSGSGGVGKTTTAAVLAMEAARAGRRAVVVTIDPAKRLADALGLGEMGIGNDPRRIDGPWPGELSAVMLDTKGTFDALVTRYSSDPEQAARILENRFYKNISGALSGTQEYMAMEKLYDLQTSPDFDLVVVDTPPSRNALDFLDAPRRLTRFLDHRLYRVLMAPTRGMMKAVNVAAQAFIRSVSKVVGGEVFDDAVAFFQAFDGMEEGFKERAELVLDLLSSPVTSFVLVASPKRDTVDEAEFFAGKLAEADIAVSALVVNRMHPRFTDSSPSTLAARAETLAGTAIGDLYRNLAEFTSVADREEHHLTGLADKVAPAPMVRVPFLRTDVHDLASLDLVADQMFGRAT